MREREARKSIASSSRYIRTTNFHMIMRAALRNLLLYCHLSSITLINNIKSLLDKKKKNSNNSITTKSDTWNLWWHEIRVQLHQLPR